jgi:hypothetical protein
VPASKAFGVQRNALQKLRLRAGGRLESELAIGIGRGDAALRRAFDVTFHDEIWLVHFFDFPGFFAYCDCQRVQTDRATIKFVN